MHSIVDPNTSSLLVFPIMQLKRLSTSIILRVLLFWLSQYIFLLSLYAIIIFSELKNTLWAFLVFLFFWSDCSNLYVLWNNFLNYNPWRNCGKVIILYIFQKHLKMYYYTRNWGVQVLGNSFLWIRFYLPWSDKVLKGIVLLVTF